MPTEVHDGSARVLPAGSRAGAVEAAGLIAAMLVLVVFRLHGFGLPLETDECNYAYIGGRLLEGDRLYVDVWDHQPPGVFVLFAGVIAVFGGEDVVFRWMATGFSAGSLLLIHGMLRRWVGVWWGLAGAMLFAVASSDPGTAGEGCNREIYMNMLILGAWYAILACPGRWGPRVAGAGLALGLGSAIKTVVAVHWVVLLAFVLVGGVADGAGRDGVRAGARRMALLHSAVLFAAGPAAVWLATGGYFAVTGRWSEFVDAVFGFNLGYAGGGGSLLSRFFGFFTPQGHPFVFDGAMPLWVGGAAGAVWLGWCAARRRDRVSFAALGLLVAGYVAACLPAHFWPHYYYLLIPALVVAVSTACARLSGAGSLRYAGPAVWAVVLAGLVFTQYGEYLSQPPFGITVKRYNSRDFWAQGMGRKVREVTDPSDTVFVFGSDTGVYHYADRRCSSRYTMITGLADGYPGVEARREILLGELRDRRPRIILLMGDQQPFPGWKSFLDEYYGEPIGYEFHDTKVTERGRALVAFVLTSREHPVGPVDPMWWDWDRAEVGGWMPDREGRRPAGAARGDGG